MEKYKALKEYIKQCDKVEVPYFLAKDNHIVSFYHMSEWSSDKIIYDINSLLKEIPFDGFWKRLEDFVSNVKVNDQPSEEEKEMILHICNQQKSEQNESKKMYRGEICKEGWYIRYFKENNEVYFEYSKDIDETTKFMIEPNIKQAYEQNKEIVHRMLNIKTE